MTPQEEIINYLNSLPEEEAKKILEGIITPNQKGYKVHGISRPKLDELYQRINPDSEKRVGIDYDFLDTLYRLYKQFHQ